MAGRGARGATSRPEQAAAYVATMARELKAMVEPHELTLLAYLLELVRLEAEARAKGRDLT
jgi:hypothetical protein